MTYDRGARTIEDGNEERITRLRWCPSCGTKIVEHQTTIFRYYPESHSLPIPLPDSPGEGRISPDTA